MKKILKILNVANYEVTMFLCSAKFWTLLFMSWIFIDLSYGGIYQFAINNDLTMPPVLFIFYYSTGIFCNIGFILLVFILSDLPFRDNNQIFLLQRCGRKVLCIGQMVTICFISFLFSAIQILFSAIMIYRCIGFDGWGKVWGSIADGIARDMGYSITVGVKQSIISNYTPGEALGISFILVSLMGICYGMFVYLFNNIGGGKAGTIIMSIWSLIWLLLQGMSGYDLVRYIIKYSPQCWLDLGYMETGQFVEKMVHIICLIFLLAIINVIVENKNGE